MLGAMSVDSGNPLAWKALFAPWVTAELPEAERKSLGTQKVPMMTSVNRCAVPSVAMPTNLSGLPRNYKKFSVI